MKRTACGLAIALVALFSAPAFAGDPASRQECVKDASEMMHEVFAESPYVVQLRVITPKGGISGSATIIEYNGTRYYLTNAHVVSQFVRGWVSREGVANAPMEEVKVVGTDPFVDIALVAEAAVTKSVPAAKLGNSDDLAIGETMYALGYPFGTRTVAIGNITAFDLPYPFFFTTQVPINPGNSGGPLFNCRHEIVAMNTAKLGDASLVSFSMPVNLIKQLLPRLTKERVVRHGWINEVAVYDTEKMVPYLFEQLGLSYPPPVNGAMVVAVDTSAANMKLQVGDVIEKVDGKTVSSVKQLRLLLFFEHKPDDDVVLSVNRNGKSLDVKVHLTEMQMPAQGKESD